MAACYQQQFQCLGLVDQPGFEENQQDEEIEELIDYSDNGEEDEDLDFEDHGADRSVDDNKFDEIVGSLEELLISPEFEELQSSFGHAHCNEFEDDGENKLVYTAIFEKYRFVTHSECELFDFMFKFFHWKSSFCHVLESNSVPACTCIVNCLVTR